MSVNLMISTEEAQVLLSCLRFVRKNLVPSAEAANFKFVGGQPLNMSFRDGVSIDFLSDYVAKETERTLNTHPLNPFISCF